MKSIKIPGKVMLSGEYAVLYGGTAVLLSVPRYILISEGEPAENQITSPVIGESLSIPISELMEFERKFGLPNIEMDKKEFYHQFDDGREVKLGLGSSSAEAAGIIALRFKRAGFDISNNRMTISKYAIMAHRKAQGGKGSGADVAACVFAEPIKFKLERNNFKIDRINIAPPRYDIPLALVWTGEAADTRDFVDRFNVWISADSEKSKGILKELIRSADYLADLWFSAPKSELFPALDEFTELVGRYTALAGIRYELPIHRRLREWAVSNGGRCKPTGAGGGDMALFIGDLPLEELKMLTIPLKKVRAVS